MSHIYIMVDVDKENPYTKPKRGWTSSKDTAQAYNENFVDGEATVKMCSHAEEDPDLEGVPERDENDNIIT